MNSSIKHCRNSYQNVIATQVYYPRTGFDKTTLNEIKFSIYIAKNVEAGINMEGGKILKKE